MRRPPEREKARGCTLAVTRNLSNLRKTNGAGAQRHLVCDVALLPLSRSLQVFYFRPLQGTRRNRLSKIEQRIEEAFYSAERI